MVKFGLTVFYLFGLTVNFSAFRFSYYSAFRIRPNGSVRLKLMSHGFQKTKIIRKVTSTYEKFPIFELEAKHGESERIMTFVWGTKHRHLIYRLLK